MRIKVSICVSRGVTTTQKMSSTSCQSNTRAALDQTKPPSEWMDLRILPVHSADPIRPPAYIRAATQYLRYLIPAHPMTPPRQHPEHTDPDSNSSATEAQWSPAKTKRSQARCTWRHVWPDSEEGTQKNITRRSVFRARSVYIIAFPSRGCAHSSGGAQAGSSSATPNPQVEAKNSLTDQVREIESNGAPIPSARYWN